LADESHDERAIMGLLDGAGKNITDGFAKAREKAEDAGDFVADKAGDAGEFVKDKAGDVGEFVKDRAEDVGEFVEDTVDRIKGDGDDADVAVVDVVDDDEDPVLGAKGGAGV
jgi:hypothetical protein